MSARDRLLDLVPREAPWLLASGVLLGLACPPFDLLFPSFVALVPYALWLYGLPEGPEGRREALRGGFFLGLVYYTLVLHWLVVALVWYTWLALPAFLVPVLILSGLLALASRGIHEARHRLGWAVWIGLPVFWTANEWLRAHLGDVAFPWMQLGDTLTGFPWLIGAADVVGSRGLSFWLALANALVAEIALRWREGAARRVVPRSARAIGQGEGGARRLVGPGLALAVALAVPTGYSLHRWSSVELRPAARVAVIQPNVPEHVKLDREAAIDSALSSTRTLLARHGDAWRGQVDLLLFPEITLPMPLEGRAGGRSPELRAWAAGLADGLGASVLVGAYGGEPTRGGRLYNSAFLVTDDGRWTERYDKQYLVPIVERVPFLDPDRLGFLGPYFGVLGAGGTDGLQSLDGARFGVMICYESIFSRLGRRYRRAGADFLVNITNDAWYGRQEPWWSRSSALWQHPAHLVMRAVETRVGIARAANTGISGLVDPLGRVHHRTALFETTAFAGTVATTDGMTLYVRFGDVVGWAAALAAATAVGLMVLRRRDRRRAAGDGLR